MREEMGTFRVDLEIENPAHMGQRRTLKSALVDTGELRVGQVDVKRLTAVQDASRQKTLLPLADLLYRGGCRLAGPSAASPRIAAIGLSALLAPMNGSVGASVVMLSRVVAPRLQLLGGGGGADPNEPRGALNDREQKIIRTVSRRGYLPDAEAVAVADHPHL